MRGALGVSCSGFHAWLTRKPGSRELGDEAIGARVRASFVANDRTCGARRVWRGVFAEGIACGLHRIEWLMRLQGLRAAMTAELVTDALVMAIWCRGRPDALLHHSDHGSQYTSAAFQRLMAANGVTGSKSRTGNAWDNAASESFFSSLKSERTARRTYRTRDEARADGSDYIERCHKTHRRHSTLGYLSPVEVEMKAASA